MAVFSCESELRVEMSDFWAWVESQGHDLNTPMAPAFSVKDDAILLKTTDGSEVFIDGGKFWAWVNRDCLPKGFSHFETIYGVPEFKESHTLLIKFATGSDGTPSEWVKPPEFLKAWKSLLIIDQCRPAFQEKHDHGKGLPEANQ
jgi:hypothetical protein